MKFLMIIAKKGFRDEEFKIPYDYFRKKQVIVDVASTEAGGCVGMFATVAQANISLEDADEKLDEYNAIILIGGIGTKLLTGNHIIENILKKAKEKGLVIAAICYAPIILAKAGILKNKKATVCFEESKTLEQYNTKFTNQEVVRDGLVITANGPAASQKFAQEILFLADDLF